MVRILRCACKVLDKITYGWGTRERINYVTLAIFNYDVNYH